MEGQEAGTWQIQVATNPKPSLACSIVRFLTGPNYNPDWAVMIEKDGCERVYFVVETKSSLFAEDLRGKEVARIKCGRAQFQALFEDAQRAKYKVASSLDELWTDVEAACLENA